MIIIYERKDYILNAVGVMIFPLSYLKYGFPDVMRKLIAWPDLIRKNPTKTPKNLILFPAQDFLLTNLFFFPIVKKSQSERFATYSIYCSRPNWICTTGDLFFAPTWTRAKRIRKSFKNWRQRIPRALETSVDLNAEHRAINERQGRKSGFSVFFNNPTPPRDTRGV
ncbi:hypothetical protein CEXT_100011 [Caerostris extrusa]|uniref:Uncharacterized protein n=1 Tax=Caerostris extrusa TaxID=172846 RepID=A0AAV4XF74_CAEEX|nr:hypothetical protein CEXT_100011 [Caerostris extrusa]